MARIIEQRFTSDVRWCVHRGDPVEYRLASLPGWALVNPLMYPAVSASLGSALFRYRLGEIVDDSILIETNISQFRAPVPVPDSVTIRRQLEAFTATFMVHLRQASKQAEIARALLGGIGMPEREVDLLPPVFPLAEAGSSDYVHNSDVHTAITWAHLRQADAAMMQGEPPLHKSVLLDAVQAFLERDDRRAVLYAAIAVEVGAKATLHAAGAMRLKAPKGVSVFEWLLHVQSQNVLGRSLRDDDPALYQTAQRLYHTRNQFVHEGITSGDVDLLPSHGEGAYHALGCANRIFQWLGEPDDYMPKHGSTVCQVPIGWRLDISRYPRMLPRIY